jgi:antitoxin component of MazEF toxin-antitoxin module
MSVRFRRKIRRSGGSAAVVIPPEVLEALGWRIGDTVTIYIEGSRLAIERQESLRAPERK